MNKLNYFLLLFLSLFVLTSVVVKPKSFENYFKFDMEATIPEESLNGDLQKKQNTVQGLLEKTVQKISKASNRIIVYGAGRTDTGVHALSQVVHFDTTKKRKDYKWIQGINSFYQLIL